ncbi:MAG: D-alanyl-D-alanine carboxypeptidase [Clostridia bacterium]|nr:D-alanyl-D-alanine carboxypeptidase [Clostridia bacterium]
MKTKLLIIFCAVIALMCALSGTVSAEGEDLPDLSRVQNVCVYNIENDKVLYQKNEEDRIYPASTVKIMTGIIALEFYDGDLTGEITVTKESLGSFKGKNIKLKDGEVVTVKDLIYAVIVGGANDAANVLAYEISGSHEIFIDLMNNRALEIGMTDTNYTNCYGYTDPEMYTTAKDTMTLAKYAYYVPGYMDICSISRYTFNETNMSKVRYIYNSNYLIATNVETKYRNKEVMGMNAGSTIEGGYAVVTAVSKKSMTNIFVVMGGAYDDENIYSYHAVNDMIKWSYKHYGYRRILDSGEMICEIDVNLSSQVDYVVLSPEKSIEYYLPATVDIEKDIVRNIELYQDSLDAPIDSGYVAGKITLVYGGNVIGEANLITKNSVDRNSFLYILARIKNVTSSPKFKIVAWTFFIVLALYLGIKIYNKTRSKRYRYKYRNKRR